jgi:hypothetical protein
VHGGILARRDLPDHMAAIEQHSITPIDVVVVNLYPFRQTVTAADKPSYEVRCRGLVCAGVCAGGVGRSQPSLLAAAGSMVVAVSFRSVEVSWRCWGAREHTWDHTRALSN